MSTYRTATVGVSKDIGLPHGDRVLRETFLRLCSKAGTPFSYYAAMCMKAGDLDALTSFKIDPFFYTWNRRYEDFELDYQIVAFFKKYRDFKLDINREEVAYDKWLKAETKCREVNSFFRSRWEGKSPPLSFPVEEILYLARRKITEILGTVKPRDISYLRDGCRHGPGGDLDLVRQRASHYEKYRSRGSITAACVEVYDWVFGNDPDYRQDFAHDAKTVSNSKLSFVPKTARVDRAICIEPRWNVYIQLGIGRLIEQRLRRYGIDIQCQERNQESARRAWAEGLATIDLSSASDTISTNLVIDLLANCDPLWLDLILKTRSPYTMYKGKLIRLEKISSMGNGYTFPLETLIFYALSWAATHFARGKTSEVRAYGDDLIVPRAVFSQLVEVLTTVGFSVNTDKSFSSGDFFESCGKDYYRGREVRPFFVSEKVQYLSQFIVLHNQIVDWANRNLEKGYYWSERLSVAGTVIAGIPSHLRNFGPVGLSGVLHAPFERWKLKMRKVDGFLTARVKCLVPKPNRRLGYSERGLLYSKLSGAGGDRKSVV